MKILLTAKRVTDYSVKVHPLPDGSAPDTEHTRKALNPFDEIAAEHALQMKERGEATEIVAVTVGPDGSEEALRACCALGADRGIFVKTGAPLFPRAVAKIIAAVAKREAPDLILSGKQNIDGDYNQTPQMIAALLGLPQMTFCSEIAVENGAAVCGRETDGGIVRVKCTLPAVISCDLRLNVPRRPSLPQIMKARSAPVETLTPEELGADIASALTQTRVAEPEGRPKGVTVADIDALYNALREKGAL